jgi:hypothetical protein
MRFKHPKIRSMISRFEQKSGARLIDFEFGDWRDFFIRPEDKFKSLKRQGGHPFVIEIENYNSSDFFQDKPRQYKIEGITKNIKMLKIFLPEKPPKNNTWYYLDVKEGKQTSATYFYTLDRIKIVQFGYHLTLYSPGRR